MKNTVSEQEITLCTLCGYTTNGVGAAKVPLALTSLALGDKMGTLLIFGFFGIFWLPLKRYFDRKQCELAPLA